MGRLKLLTARTEKCRKMGTDSHRTSSEVHHALPERTLFVLVVFFDKILGMDAGSDSKRRRRD